MFTLQNDAVRVTPQNTHRHKLLDIERGKGLGILMVVYGHLVMHSTFGEPYWYNISKFTVYLFHMPFFMYLSGFVFYYVGSYIFRQEKYLTFCLTRLDRLIVPFIVISLFVVIGKYAGGMFAHVDDGVSDLGSAIWSVISNAPKNPSISVWYLLVLFIYSVATPILLLFFRRNILILLVLAFSMYFLPLTELFYLKRIFSYYIFFVLGLLIAEKRILFLDFFKTYWLFFLVGFLVALFFGKQLPYAMLICGVLSIPALHGLLLLPIFENDKFLLFIGENSMVIYLLNTVVIGLSKVAYVKLFPYDGMWFAVFISFLLVSAVSGPIILKWILAQSRVTSYVYKYIK